MIEMNKANTVAICINIHYNKYLNIREHTTHWRHSQTKRVDAQWTGYLIQNHGENIKFIAVAAMGYSKDYVVILFDVECHVIFMKNQRKSGCTLGI